METNKTNRLDDQILRSKRIEFMMKNLDYSKDVLVETKNSLLDFGHYILGELSDEFNNKTDNAVKFENDFNVAVSNHQEITHSYFKDSEIERLTDINNLIIKCFGNKRVFRMLNQYILMCNYLDFLQDYQPAPSNTNKRKTQPPTREPKQPLTFKELFVKPYSENIESLLIQLKNAGLTETDNSWKEWENGLVEKNETAKLYYYLKSKNVLNDYDKTPALICFNEKFGIEVYKYNEIPNSDRFVSIKTLTNSEKTATKTELQVKFETVFNKWIEKIELK